ncbi:MAG: ankyrin repeat domain-containing protein [Coxiellaceae bacterium]|nr:ankyrin repeat domain-containing protein [Coxiellaceae bacterium]
MSRREPTSEARLIGQALFAPNGQRDVDAFIQLRDRCDKRKVFKELKLVFTSDVSLQQKINAYKNLCSMDTHKVFLNYLHSRLPEILESIADPADKERFLLTGWAGSRDIVFKRQLQALKNPTQLATLEIQYPDLTDVDQQSKLMTLVETDNEVALLYWKIKQPTLLRAAEVSSGSEAAESDSEDSSYIDSNLLLLDMIEQYKLFIRYTVEEGEDFDRHFTTLHETNIDKLKSYIAFKYDMHPDSPLISRLASELLTTIKHECSTRELDVEILQYKIKAMVHGDIAYYREVYPDISPERCLESAQSDYKAAILVMHALAGVPLAECDESAVSDVLFTITPELQQQYRRALAECYLEGYTVVKDVIYANQLLGLETSLVASAVAEAKDGGAVAGGALTIEQKAQQALGDCAYSMRYGEVVTHTASHLAKFTQRQLSAHMLNVGCPLEAVSEYGRFVPGIVVAERLLSGSYERYTGQTIAEHYAGYIRTAGAEFESFSMAELSAIQTSIYRNLNAAAGDGSDNIYERLRRGEVVDIYSGWVKGDSGHILQCSFKMIEGECYLMYANSGEGSRRIGSGINLYHIGNPEMLSSPHFVKRLQRGFSEYRFVVSLDKTRHGLGRDLQLTPLAFVPKKPQKNGNCGLKAAKNQVLMQLMFGKLDELCKQEGVAPNQAMLDQSHQMAYEWYKPFVAYSRQQSVAASLKFCDETFPAHIKPAQFPHVIKQILDYIKSKDTSNQADLMQLLLPVQEFLNTHDIEGRAMLLGQLADTKLQLLQNTLTEEAPYISTVMAGFTSEELTPHVGLLNAVMFEAAKQGDIQAIERCLSHGCSIDSTDDYDATLLMQAASAGQTDCAKWLLDQGAINPFAIDRDKKNASDHARENGHDYCLRVLEAYPDEPAPSSHVRQSLFAQAPRPVDVAEDGAQPPVFRAPTFH